MKLEGENMKGNSLSEYALNNALLALDLLSTGKLSTQNLVRRCSMIAKFLGDNESYQWMKKELSGYVETDEFPTYRRFRFSRLVGGEEKRNVRDSIHRVEFAAKKNDNLIISSKDNDGKFIGADWCHNLVSSVEDRCVEFLSDVIVQVGYSGMIDSIIGEIKDTVERNTSSLGDEFSVEIQSISSHMASNEPSEWSKAAHSCRRSLHMLANRVFPPTTDAGLGVKLDDSAYMNRLLTYLDLQKSSLVVKSEVSLLAKVFDQQRELSGKAEHSAVKRYEIEQIIVLTYLIIAEVMRCVEKEQAKENKQTKITEHPSENN